MYLSKLYPNINSDIIIRGITDDSRNVKSNYIFVAIKGHKYDGNNFINEAIQNGACLIITDSKRTNSNNTIVVKDAKKELIRLLQIFYYYKRSIYTIGVTGTDGKTTISAYLKSIFNILNPTGVIGTNGIDYLNYHIDTINTTPSVETLYKSYQHMNHNNIKDLIIEVSSEGIIDHRVDNFNFNGVIISNLTHEHLNTHKTMHKYFLSKMKLIKSLNKNALLIYNIEDNYVKKSKYFAECPKLSFGFNKGDFQVRDYIINLEGSIFNVYYHNTFIGTFKTKLFGKYNISNALAAIAYTYELGIPIEVIKDGILALDKVNGRFMLYEKNGITGIVDFAHTPNGIYNLLSNLQIINKGRIIIILGAQGYKDESKRSIMGMVASKLADVIIFTSEDPKDESLFGIYYDLTKNIKNKDYYLSLSRRQAIELAVKLARPNDYIVITGKGDENEEIILDYHIKQNDYKMLKEALDS